ncbi:MAG TPA: hypothetical protein VMD07_07840 [Candidatus Acidoferrales bacterium]|nr:hypothetical protein [Candidatus Acidoferrales bacterium]
MEKVARARLIAGCADDDARLEQFFAHPLDVVEREAIAALAGEGASLERDLANNLRQDAFDRIGLGFGRLVCANVGLRARARFKIYTREIADAEIAIAEAIAVMRVQRAKRLLPKMFAIQRVTIEDLRIPAAPQQASEVPDWVDELHRLVRDEVRCSVAVSRDRVLAHGSERLGIVKTRIELAIFPRVRLRARVGA